MAAGLADKDRSGVQMFRKGFLFAKMLLRGATLPTSLWSFIAFLNSDGDACIWEESRQFPEAQLPEACTCRRSLFCTADPAVADWCDCQGLLRHGWIMHVIWKLRSRGVTVPAIYSPTLCLIFTGSRHRLWHVVDTTKLMLS